MLIRVLIVSITFAAQTCECFSHWH